MTDDMGEFVAWLATRTSGTGVVPTMARAVAAGETWRLRWESSFHDPVSKAALAEARNQWLASKRTTSSGRALQPTTRSGRSSSAPSRRSSMGKPAIVKCAECGATGIERGRRMVRVRDRATGRTTYFHDSCLSGRRAAAAGGSAGGSVPGVRFSAPK